MPKKVDRSERKDHIVEAMLRIIHRSGFEKATLREIAKEGDLSLGSVQYYFPKQKDIYTFAMDEIYKRFEDRMQAVIQVEEDAFESAVRMIKQFVQVNTVEERMENDIWLKFLVMATMNSEYRETIDQFREVNVKFSKDILNTLDTNGILMDTITVEREAQSLTTFIHGLVFELVIYGDLFDKEAIENEIRAYLQKICHY